MSLLYFSQSGSNISLESNIFQFGNLEKLSILGIRNSEK